MTPGGMGRAGVGSAAPPPSLPPPPLPPLPASPPPPAAPRLRSNHGGLQLLWRWHVLRRRRRWRLGPRRPQLRLRRWRGRPRWDEDVRRRRWLCGELWRHRRDGLARGNGFDQWGRISVGRTAVRPATRLFAGNNSPTNDRPRQSHHNRGRRCLPWSRRAGDLRPSRAVRNVAPGTNYVVGVGGRPVRGAIRSRRGASPERRQLVLVGGAVGLHGGSDKAGEGASEAVAGDSAQARIVVDRKVRHRLDYAICRHAAVEFGTDFVGRDNQAWRVLEGGDAVLIKRCEKLVVLVRVGRC